MNKYYQIPKNSSRHNYNGNVSEQQNFDNFFNSNSSLSYSRDTNIKPKYFFDRLGSKRNEMDKTNSDLDLPCGFADQDIIYGANNRGYESNVDITVLNTLNLLKSEKNINNESSQASRNGVSNKMNHHPQYQNKRNTEIEAKNYNQKGMNLDKRNSTYQQSKNRNLNENKVLNGKPAQDHINKKLMEINQMLGKLIPLNEQRKNELIKKTNQNASYTKEKSRSFFSKNSSTKNYDHNSLKLLSKIRKNSSVFNINNSDDSDDESNINNIFNNNMNYLNPSLHVANPGLLKNKSQIGNYFSLPNNQSNVTVNYNNRSAGPVVGGYYYNASYTKPPTNRNFSIKENNNTQNDKRFNSTSIQNQKKKIFEINRNNLTNDSHFFNKNGNQFFESNQSYAYQPQNSYKYK